MNLKGKTVLITGGGSGLGLDAVRQFTNAGARIITCGRSLAKLQQVKELFPGTEVIQCDVSTEEEVLRLKERVEALGGLDILYNNAGAKQNHATTGYGKDDIFTKASLEIQTNYLAVIRLNELFIPLLEKSQEPVIINTSSALAYLPSGAMPTYSASKAALHSYTLALRLQLQKEQNKIKVYELMPPMVDTPFNTVATTSKLQPNVVNEALLAALGTSKFEVRPGQANALYYLQRFFPKRAFQILNPTISPK